MVIVMHELLVRDAEEGVFLLLLALLLIGAKEDESTEAVIEQIISAFAQTGYHRGQDSVRA